LADSKINVLTYRISSASNPITECVLCPGPLKHIAAADEYSAVLSYIIWLSVLGSATGLGKMSSVWATFLAQTRRFLVSNAFWRPKWSYWIGPKSKHIWQLWGRKLGVFLLKPTGHTCYRSYRTEKIAYVEERRSKMLPMYESLFYW